MYDLSEVNALKYNKIDNLSNMGIGGCDELNEREFSREKRQQLASEGKALPDGSYPIVNKKDLTNAIHTYGLGKDHKAAKAHIIKRAKALGASKMIPENWL